MTDEMSAVLFGGHISFGETSKAHVLHLPTMVSHLWVIILELSRGFYLGLDVYNINCTVHIQCNQ